MAINHTLYNDGTYTIRAHKEPGRAWYLQVNNERVGWSDYPVKWPDGRIAYDTPEKVPVRIKRVVRSILLDRSRKYATLRDVVRTFGQ